MSKQFMEALLSLKKLACTAESSGLTTALEAHGGCQGENLVDRLRSQLAYIKSQDVSGLDFTAEASSGLEVKLTNAGKLGAWTQPTPLDIIWTCCTKLWNACLEHSNVQVVATDGQKNDKPTDKDVVSTVTATTDTESDKKQVAWVKLCICELSGLVPEEQLSYVHASNKITFSLGAAASWTILGELEHAEICLGLGSRAVSTILALLMALDSQDLPPDWEQVLTSVFDLKILRLTNLWQLGQDAAASQLTAECCAAACGVAEGWEKLMSINSFRQVGSNAGITSRSLCQTLSLHLLHRALDIIEDTSSCAPCHVHDSAKACTDQTAGSTEQVLQLLESAYDLVQHAMADDPDGLQSGHQAAQATFKSLERELLLWMLYAHVQAGNGPKACSCFSALHSNAGPDTLELCPAAIALNISALAMQSKIRDAEGEIVALMTNNYASAELCMEVVSDMLDRGAHLDALYTAVKILHDRCSEKGGALEASKIMVAFAAMVALDAGRIEAEGEAVDQLLLEVMGSDLKLGGEADLEAPDIKATCKLLLWNQAVRCFKDKHWDRAFALFQACISYIPGPEEEFQARRTLALCCLGMNQSQQALQNLKEAEACATKMPEAVGYSALAFIRLKIYLDLGDVAAAEEQVDHVCHCKDFSSSVLEVMCQEAAKAGQFAIAAKVLIKLHARQVTAQLQDQQQSQPRDPSSLTEASVLRTLVLCIINGNKKGNGGGTGKDADDTETAEVDQGKRQDVREAVHTELAKYLHLASERLKILGFEAFFGDEDSGKAICLDWFSGIAWSRAQEAADDGDMQSSAVMLAAYATLALMHPHQLPVHKQRIKIAYVMAAVSAIEVHKNNMEHKASLLLALSMIKAVRDLKAEQAAAAGLTLAQPMPMDSDETFLAFLELTIALRMRDEDKIQAVLTDSLRRATSACLPTRLLQIASDYEGGPYQNPAACRACRALALERLMAEASPDPDLVAKVVQSLIQTATNDEERLQQYKEAASIVAALSTLASVALSSEANMGPSSAPAKLLERRGYPDLDLRWLTTSCWNKGVTHARFSRLNEASGYMQVAMRLLDHCPSLANSHKACMVEAQRRVANMAKS